MNLLVAVDFSPVTERVIAVALELVGDAGRITLLHVANPEPEFVGYDAGPQVVRDQVAEEFRAQRRSLQEIADRLRSAGVETTPLVIQGVIVETIIEHAQRVDARFIVVGTHGRGPVFGLLIGSVSEGLIRRSPLPVVVVPPAVGP
jgi:nucleotide-binding universal stress UspA family protein